MIPDHYFDRFETKKYRSKDPIKRHLIRRFAERLHGLFVEANPVESVLEVGVGEGFLSGYLSERFPEKTFVGVDLDGEDLRRLSEKFPSIAAHVGSVYDLSFLGRSFDLILCPEILEHLDEPDRALAEIQRMAPKRAIFTVPHEPFFMLSNLLRGNNVTRLGNDIDHRNHWTARSFAKLLAPRFDVLALETSFPFLLALATPRL